MSLSHEHQHFRDQALGRLAAQTVAVILIENQLRAWYRPRDQQGHPGGDDILLRAVDTARPIDLHVHVATAAYPSWP